MTTLHRGRRIPALTLFFIVLALVVVPAPQVAADPAITDQLLDVHDLHGYVLDFDEPIESADLYPTRSLYWDQIREQTTLRAHKRLFVSYHNDAMVGIVLVEYRQSRIARELLPQRGGRRVAVPMPPGAVVRSSAGPSPSWDGVRVEFTKGRMLARIEVFAMSAGADPYRVVARLERRAAAVANAQYERLHPAADLPGGDRISLSRSQRAVYQGLISTIVLPLLLIGLGSVLLDRSARQRLLLRINRRVARTPPVGAYLDVSARVRPRLRSHRRRVIIRTTIVVICLLAMVRLSSVSYLAVFVIAAVVVVASEIVGLPRGRRSFRGAFGWKAALLVIGSVGSTGLAMVGGLLVTLSVSIRYGGIPIRGTTEAAARTAGSLLLLLGILPLALAAFLYRFVRRLAQRQAKELLNRDKRSPILLLRSWADDHLMMRARRTGRHALLERLSLRRWDRFEEIITWALWGHGPVIAAGEPGTRLPRLGAARDFFPDKGWRPGVQQLMDRAGLIVITVGRTGNLVWEMQEPGARGLLGRTIYLIPPVKDDERRLRLRVLASALGIEPTLLDCERLGLQVLAVLVDNQFQPLVITGEVRDDASYEVALEAAIEAIRTPAGNSTDDRVKMQRRPLLVSRDTGDQLQTLLVERGRGTKPSRPWYLRWQAVVWIVVILLGLGMRVLEGIGSQEQLPAIPGTRVSTGGRPAALVPSPRGLLVVNEGNRSLQMISRDRHAVQNVHRFDETPTNAAADAGRAFVTSLGSDRVQSVTMTPATDSTDSRSWERSVRTAPNALAAVGRDVLVPLLGSNQVAVLNRSTGAVRRKLDVGNAPWDVAVANQLVFISHANDDTVAVLRRPGYERVATIQVAHGPRDLAVDGNHVYVSSTLSDRVTDIDTRTLEVLRETTVPGLANSIAADNGRIAVTVSGRISQVVVIEAKTGHVVRTIPLPVLPADIAFDGQQLAMSLIQIGAVAYISVSP